MRCNVAVLPAAEFKTLRKFILLFSEVVKIFYFFFPTGHVNSQEVPTTLFLFVHVMDKCTSLKEGLRARGNMADINLKKAWNIEKNMYK